MQFATVRLYGFNGQIGWRLSVAKAVFGEQKRYPSGLVSDKTPTPFYGSGGKHFSVAEACEDGFKRITCLLSCDLSESSVADGGYHCL